MTLSNDTVGWSAVCECGTSWSYPYTFFIIYVASDAVRSTAVVLLLLIHSLLFCVCFVFGPCCAAQRLVSFFILQPSRWVALLKLPFGVA